MPSTEIQHLADEGDVVSYPTAFKEYKLHTKDVHHRKFGHTQPENSELQATLCNLTESLRELESRIALLESGLRPQNTTVTEPKKVMKKNSGDARINYIENRFDKSKGKRIDKEVEDLNEGKAPDTLLPITVKRTFKDDNMTIEKTEVIIRSPQLLGILQEVLSTYLKHDFQSTFHRKEVVLASPFIPLLFNWEQLQAATTDAKILQRYGQGNVNDLILLLDLVQRLAPEYTQSWNNILQSKTVLLKYIFTLFKPGRLVVTMPYANSPQLMKVHHFGAGSISNDNNTASVFCEGYDWDGTRLERLRYEFPMPKMQATERIGVRDLPCYPVEMYEDEHGATGIEALRKNLIERGQKFERLCLLEDNVGRRYQYKGQFQAEGDLRSGLLSGSYSRSQILDFEISLPKSLRSRTLSLQPPLTVWSHLPEPTLR
jgi:uncharacterized coiled-coil protein SlyX